MPNKDSCLLIAVMNQGMRRTALQKEKLVDTKRVHRM